MDMEHHVAKCNKHSFCFLLRGVFTPNIIVNVNNFNYLKKGVLDTIRQTKTVSLFTQFPFYSHGNNLV